MMVWEATILAMMATKVGARKRKKKIRRISTLYLEEVDIILYDFTLTKSGHLRKSTIAMLTEKLKVTSKRQTRSKTYNPREVGLNSDEDNALIISSKEDGSYYMDTSDTSGFEAND